MYIDVSGFMDWSKCSNLLHTTATIHKKLMNHRKNNAWHTKTTQKSPSTLFSKWLRNFRVCVFNTHFGVFLTMTFSRLCFYWRWHGNDNGEHQFVDSLSNTHRHTVSYVMCAYICVGVSSIYQWRVSFMFLSYSLA